jgi:energy-coupling factor transport system ATP-binding protein
VIEVADLHYRYPGFEAPPALRGVSFSVRPGEIVALMGANGSGKTTLVRCLNGLLTPESGDVTVDGLSVRDPERIHEIRRKIGLVFQNPDDQIVSATVEREIAFGLENLGVPSKTIIEKVDFALRQFHLDFARFHSPHLLSGGERQRLALASVWVMEPDYYILDEPTSLLDPAGRREIRRFLEDRRREQKSGFIFVTQYPDEALQCDRLILLGEGSVAYDGPPREGFGNDELCSRLMIGIPASVELERFWEEIRPASPA